MKKVAIYSRKSKYTGKGDSIENQIEMCKNYVLRTLTDVDKDSYVFAFRKDYPISEIKEKFIQKKLSNLPKLTACANKIRIGMRLVSTRQGQTSFFLSFLC